MEASESLNPEPTAPVEPVAPEAVKPVAEPQPTAEPKDAPAPVRVDNKSRRSDDDALEGHFALVVDGEHKGQIGSFVNVTEYDQETGYPYRILLRFRDANYTREYDVVDYSSVRPADPYRGGR